jgi:hypothetical protein
MRKIQTFLELKRFKEGDKFGIIENGEVVYYKFLCAHPDSGAWIVAYRPVNVFIPISTLDFNRKDKVFITAEDYDEAFLTEVKVNQLKDKIKMIRELSKTS